MNNRSFYSQESIILTTKHCKSTAIAPVFLKKLSAKIIECPLDTDILGTFSGEVERKGNMLHCAQIKCELGMHHTNAEYGLASEGSFGPHPYIPFLPCDQEILFFIDRKRNFNLHLSHLSHKTNYNMQSIQSLQELYGFAKKALFPSHALILRPDHDTKNQYIVKGINNTAMLESAFYDCIKHATNGHVWVETDMRAHLNPTRMTVIEELANSLADRLLTLCPACTTPGWGKIKINKGLECSWCGMPTDLMKSETYGCVTCSHTKTEPRSDNLSQADPQDCAYCNP